MWFEINYLKNNFSIFLNKFFSKEIMALSGYWEWPLTYLRMCPSVLINGLNWISGLYLILINILLLI